MVTATLKDETPTTTITFDGFHAHNRTLDAKNFSVLPMPEGDPQLVIHILQYMDFIHIDWELKNDSTGPSSGDSAADKVAELIDFILSGGDSEGFFTLTFDSEDSTPAAPQTETYTGRIRKLFVPSSAGVNVAFIKGNFTFYLSIPDDA